jgi:hypothetical protein
MATKQASHAEGEKKPPVLGLICDASVWDISDILFSSNCLSVSSII